VACRPQDENVGIPAIERRAFIEGIFNLRETDQPESGRWNSGRSGGASNSTWRTGGGGAGRPAEALADVEALRSLIVLAGMREWNPLIS